VLCGARLKRNGRTSAGRTRWRCTGCGSSSLWQRADVARVADLDRFLSWLMGRATQRDLRGGTSRTFHRRHAWCWNIAPTIAVTGEIYDEIQLDGTYLSDGWCLVVAIDGATGQVIAWQWCDTEKTAAWCALLERIPPPRVVVVDGGSGLASALKACWPNTRIQRCLVHVQRGVRTYVTTRPRTDAGRSLRVLSLALTRIRTIEEAGRWQVNLNAWHQAYGPLINTRTYLTQVDIRPAWARPHATWWWTHDRLRKAYQLLARLTRQGVLFTYLNPDLDDLTISSTTNRIEGGTNHPIKDLLRRHRGMTSDHQRRAVEWWCYLHSPDPRPPRNLIKPEHWAPAPSPQPRDTEPKDVRLYDTNATPEEGLWSRKGWAGRST